MKQLFDIQYYDGPTGVLRQERVFAAPFLHWSYNTSIGRLATRLVLSRRIVSVPLGWICRSRWSRKLVPPFVRWSRIDERELPRPPQAYRSFHDFFTRSIPAAKRPIGGDDFACVSPVDAKVLVIPRVQVNEPLQIKRSLFNLGRLLHDDPSTARFNGGTVLVFRLGLSDYHRFHFPVSGVASRPVYVDGRCYAGGGYDQGRLVPHFSDNVRMVTMLESDHFGLVAMVEVGAFTVGSIVQRFAPGTRVRRGDEKGWFEPGGSTVVLVFEPGRIVCDTALLAHSSEGIETKVRVGEAVGYVADRRIV